MNVPLLQVTYNEEYGYYVTAVADENYSALLWNILRRFRLGSQNWIKPFPFGPAWVYEITYLSVRITD
jgi:hypothetical protein